MPFWKLYYHLVWATKNRLPIIHQEFEPQLYQFLIDRALEMDVFVYTVNGYFDHVHILTAIPPKHAVATVVKNLKGSSSHFINEFSLSNDYFSWQRGYGALSLGEKQLPIAKKYVSNQKLHHEKESTNSWLERTADFDEGPLEIQSKMVLKETGEIYLIDTVDFPF
jgi:putative transposase